MSPIAEVVRAAPSISLRLKVSGTPSVDQRSSGQTRTNARPTTLSDGIVPFPGSSMCTRESAESERWSPITQSRFGGTVTLNCRSDGLSPG